MSKIDDLIKELCPNGVELRAIEEIGTYRRGSFPQPYGLEKWYDDENGMPFVQVVDVENDKFLLTPTTRRRISLEAQKMSVFAPVGTLIITIQGTIGRVAITQYEAYIDRTLLVFKDTDNTINKTFLAYVLKHKFAFEEKTARGSTLKTITKEELRKFLIPIPPLELQNEIVRILDNFSALEAELEVELEARTQQYEFYRNKLLDFSSGSVGIPKIDKMLAELCPNGVEFDIISNVFYFRNGYTPSKDNPKYWENGKIPWFRMEDIRKNGTILSNAIQTVSLSGVRGNPFPANSIIVGTTATIGVHALIKVDSIANQQFTYLMLKEDFQEMINMKYFYYHMYLVDEWLKKNVSKSGFAIVNINNFKKIKIPVPPMEIQDEIVEILDNVSTYVSSLTDGLPAEIKARRQQYEYYRNKLLTF